MTKSKQTGGAGSAVVKVQGDGDETEAQTFARVMVSPYLRHGFVTKGISDKAAGKLPGNPQIDHFGEAIKSKANKLGSGDLTIASDMLVAQAHSLDAMFTEFARRAALNMGDYINASEIYARLALKAQSNCRSTLEALMKLHQPREQTVKHVHVNEGGQAVVADHFHAGGAENGKTIKQSHATSTALPGADAQRNGVPIPGGPRKAAVPNARRDKPRRA